MKRPYTIDGVEHFYEDDWPEPEFRSPTAQTAYSGLMETFLTPPEPTWADRIIDDIMTAVAAVVDKFVKLPPISWLDALLRGPVGPQ